jgi:phosphoglycolate phosphatase-like HAD superfamily hydrolase
LLNGYLRRLPTYLARHQGRILPGIAELLKQLSPRTDVAVGLLTGNVRDGARLKLGHYGLYEHFAFGGFGDHHMDRDDVAREALEVACRHLGCWVNRDCSWVIGDTPLDIRCARAIGVRVAAVATGWHSREQLAAEKPDLLFDDLADPTPLLHCWK